jgi:UDP-3-O-[3-hydroxymyristoyl] N-acetylglucosamine deacetylase
MFMQKTIKQAIVCSGIGLHSGNRIDMTCKPGAAHSGIVFERTDLADRPRVRVEPQNIADVSYATTLGKGAATVKTVEHLLSAAKGLGIDNLLIEINGGEAPIIDGSAACFVNMFLNAGIVDQRAQKRIIRIRQPFDVRVKDSILSVEPYNGLKITYTIDFPNPLIGVQTKTFEFTSLRYMQEIAPARTFCMYEEIEYLWKRGLSKGGSLDNAVVFAQDRILNDSLRFPDEPVRHKILDLLGDLAFVGHPLLGHLKVYKGGHVLHAKFAQTLLAQPECWTYLTEQDCRDSRNRLIVPADANMFAIRNAPLHRTPALSV